MKIPLLQLSRLKGNSPGLTCPLSLFLHMCPHTLAADNIDVLVPRRIDEVLIGLGHLVKGEGPDN